MSKIANDGAPRARRAPATSRRSARERVFRAAAELFHRKGIRSVGVEAIAQEANTTKMSLYRNFPSKDELVVAWLRDHDLRFWQAWDAIARANDRDPRAQLRALLDLVAKQVADPRARGCPMANAAIELTGKEHPARKLIQKHKAETRSRLAGLCARIDAPDAALLADQLFLLIEGAQTSSRVPGARAPASNVARAADALIDAHLAPRARQT